MSFTQGLSGLNASSKDLEVIGNNVANANTVGFKGSQAQFADVFAAALTGAGTAQIGIGSKLATVAQQFTQGNIRITNNNLDMAINGPGFFIMDNGHGTGYTRNGQFQLDKNGFIVSSVGHKLQGFLPNPTTGTIATGSLQPLQIQTTVASAQQTANIQLSVNLDARKLSPANTVPPGPAFDPAQPTSFNDSTSVTTYDSQGKAQLTTLYFRKQAAPVVNTWDVYMTVSDPTAAATVPPTYINPSPTPAAGAWAPVGTLAFSTNGTLPAAGSTITAPAFTPVGVAAQTFAINFGGTTQFGAAFGVTKSTQDGFTSGQLSGFSIAADGNILGRYSNGTSKSVGQVALVTFPNMQGLQPLGDNEWAQSSASGQPVLNPPGVGNNGVLQTSAVEDSNVDLTAELVNMITAQRVYQANAQTIKTQDQIMQTIVNLK